MNKKPKCDCCGKFVSYSCPCKFTPDSPFTIERYEYRCNSCSKKYGDITKEPVKLDFYS